jgi:hypothetical protein
MKRFIVFLVIAILISSFISHSGNNKKNTGEAKNADSGQYDIEKGQRPR